MPFWKRLAVTLIAMLVVSFVAGLLWQALFFFSLPSYLAGAIGGLTTIPIWEFLKSSRFTQPDKPVNSKP